MTTPENVKEFNLKSAAKATAYTLAIAAIATILMALSNKYWAVGLFQATGGHLLLVEVPLFLVGIVLGWIFLPSPLISSDKKRDSGTVLVLFMLFCVTTQIIDFLFVGNMERLIQRASSPGSILAYIATLLIAGVVSAPLLSRVMEVKHK